MKNFPNNLNAKTSSLISGAALIITFAALSFGGFLSSSSTIAATYNQNQSVGFTLNFEPCDSNITRFERAASGPVYAGEQFDLEWASRMPECANDNAGNIRLIGPGVDASGLNASGDRSVSAQEGSNTYTLIAENVEGNETDRQEITVNANYAEPVVSLVHLESPGKTRVNQPIQLDWSTSNADTVSAGGDWSTGDLPGGSTDLQGPGAVQESQPATGGVNDYITYTYRLTASNAGGSSNPAEVSVDVYPPLKTYDLVADPAAVDLEGEPGSTVTTQVRIDDTQNFSDTVDLEVDQSTIPQSQDGSDLLDVSIEDTSISGEGTETQVTIVTKNVIRADDTYTIRIQGSETPDDESDFAEIEINADGFQPRTIEEF